MGAFEHRFKQAPDGSHYVVAPAKVNLFLHITGRKDDGYHVLESLFAFTKRGDILHFRDSETLTLSLVGPGADALAEIDPETNLVMKAARLLSGRAVGNPHVAMELEKNLPPASGIGGGSSDAAAALIGLNALWQCGLSEQALAELALEIGADVPACLAAKPQIVRGIGEKTERAKLGWSAGIVLVNPRKPVSTPQAFAGFKQFRDARSLPPFDVAISDLNKVVTDLSMLDVVTSNSLQDPATQLCPDIMEIEWFLRQNSQYELLRMSGSGATVFALYHDKQAAEAVARRVREHSPNWWVMADEIGD